MTVKKVSFSITAIQVSYVEVVFGYSCNPNILNIYVCPLVSSICTSYGFVFCQFS